jgi:hypothetical protein
VWYDLPAHGGSREKVCFIMEDTEREIEGKGKTQDSQEKLQNPWLCYAREKKSTLFPFVHPSY